MSARILIVEDDPALMEVLEYNMAAERIAVRLASTGAAAQALIREQVTDLIILDRMLTDSSGTDLCRRWRAAQATSGVPILMLSARAEEADRMEGLAAGADDYVAKPFSLPELMARVRVLLNRNQLAATTDVITVGDIELDRAGHAVRRG